MKTNKILSMTILFIFMSFQGLLAFATSAQIEITAIVNGKPVAAVVRINKSKDRNYAWWSAYQPGGPALPTPLTVTLPAGKYFLHLKPLGIHSPVNEQVIPFMMSANSNMVKKIHFPVGRLKITSSEADAGQSTDALAYIHQGWRQIAPPQGRTLHTPVDLVLSPGQYEVKVIKTKDKQKISKKITVHTGKTTRLNLKFKSSHFGYLSVNVEMNGHNLPPKQYSKYGEVVILDSKSKKKIRQISGGYGQPYQLPSGQYDIKFHSFIVNDKDTLIRNVVINDNEKMSKSIHLKPPGEIKISASWSNKPKDIIKCIKSKNPFDSQRIGTLFGGPGRPAGKCFDNRIGRLITELVSESDNTKIIVRQNDIFVKPGTYKIKVWPYDHRTLSKTVDQIVIKPGSSQKSMLKYPWPFVEKKVKANNNTYTKLVRKTPLGKGEIHVSASINGLPTTSRAQFGVFKLDYRGQKDTGLFHFFTKEFGNSSGLKLPLTKTIPAGFYQAYIEPFGPQLILNRQRFDFYMGAGNTINKTIHFKTGRLKINQSKKIIQMKKLRVFITKGNNISVLQRYHQNTLPLDVKITPGEYTVKLYTKNNSVYFSKSVTVKIDKTTEIQVP